MVKLRNCEGYARYGMPYRLAAGIHKVLMGSSKTKGRTYEEPE
jgi:hypothetical protein